METQKDNYDHFYEFNSSFKTPNVWGQIGVSWFWAYFAPRLACENSDFYEIFVRLSREDTRWRDKKKLAQEKYFRIQKKSRISMKNPLSVENWWKMQLFSLFFVISTRG